MKSVIYKANGTYYVTTEENYRARIQNARAIYRLDFESAEGIVEYLCKYCGYKTEDLIIIAEEGI